jgi:hypothetical protein
MPRALRPLSTLVSLLAVTLSPGAISGAGAEGPRVEVARPLPARQPEFGVSVLPVEGDLLVSGWTSAGGSDEALLLRITASGDEVWRRSVVGGGDAAIWSLHAIGDGSFVGAGWIAASSGDLDALLVRFDGSGKILWQSAYTGPLKERLWSVDLSGKALVAAGESVAADGSSKALVLKADLDGKEIARRLAGDAPAERVFGIQAVSGGGYALAGMAGGGPREGPGYDARIARYDADGKVVWSRTWGGAGFDVAHDLRLLDDGGFLVTGYTDAGAGRGTDVFLLRLDADGKVAWSRTYGDASDDRAVHLAVRREGDVAIAGYSRNATGDWDIVVRGVSPGGDEEWTRRFGGGGDELARSIVAAGSGSVLVLGHSRSYGPIERILLVRLGL